MHGQLTCHPPCFNTFPFKIKFSGSSGGGEIRCPVCGSGYGTGFGYRRIGDQWNGKIDPSGFFYWFSPHTRGPGNEFVHSLVVSDLKVKLLSGAETPAGQAAEEFLAPLTMQERVAVCDLPPLVYRVVIEFKKTGKFPGGEVRRGVLELREDARDLTGLNEVYLNPSRGGMGTPTSGSLVDPTFGSLIELLKKLPIRDLETLIKCVALGEEATLLAQSKPRVAAILYQQAVDLNPYDDVSRMSYGCLLGMQGNLREGIDWIEKSLKLNPGNQRAQNNLQGMKAALSPKNVPVAVSTDPKRAKADGEAVKCGSCGKALTVKYHDPGKQIIASRDAMKSLALRCQDCGFIVCGQCTTPETGEGGAVCPACKKVGGPYPFTREREMARKKADDIIANAPRLDVKQPDLFVKLLNELIVLVKKDNSGFANKPRIREIGEELNRQGGMKQMQQAYYLVKNTGLYFSQDIWDGIGEWQQ